MMASTSWYTACSRWMHNANNVVPAFRRKLSSRTARVLAILYLYSIATGTAIESTMPPQHRKAWDTIKAKRYKLQNVKWFCCCCEKRILTATCYGNGKSSNLIFPCLRRSRERDTFVGHSELSRAYTKESLKHLTQLMPSESVARMIPRGHDSGRAQAPKWDRLLSQQRRSGTALTWAKADHETTEPFANEEDFFSEMWSEWCYGTGMVSHIRGTRA